MRDNIYNREKLVRKKIFYSHEKKVKTSGSSPNHGNGGKIHNSEYNNINIQ